MTAALAALAGRAGALKVPPGLEAHEPPEYRGMLRDEVRMLVTDRSTGAYRHERFDALPALLRSDDLLVANDSATLPAALAARRVDGRALAVHVSTASDAGLWVLEPRGPARESERLLLPAGAAATLLVPVDARSRRLWYARVDVPISPVDYLRAHGLPIRYAYADRSFPLADYQTIFGRLPGSAEMPSAGRPFTMRTLTALRARGVELRSVTLHCGVSSVTAHEPPPTEGFEVPAATAEAVNAARAAHRRIIAIGTTVVRALESAVRDGRVIAAAGNTDLMISPKRTPQVVDGLLTGFHEPEASHLALLAAFIETEKLAESYAAALDSGYLWHEFGDVHLIL